MPIYSNFGMKLNIPSQIVVLALRDVPKVRMMNANRNIRRDRHVLRLKSMVRRRRPSISSIVAMTNRSYEYVELRLDVRLITQHSISPHISLGYSIPECGSGVSCNGLFDHTISTVRLPANLATGHDANPTDADVVEAVCYTRTAQRWMVQKYTQDNQFWQSIGVSSPQMFFGSSTGVFRIFPARHSRECGVYDPRLRPWYQATVSSC